MQGFKTALLLALFWAAASSAQAANISSADWGATADGRKIHPAYLFEVKSPQESSGGWDMFKLLQTTSAEEAFRPMSQGGCPLVKA